MDDISEKWPPHQKILVILAHPDDPEFFCGATLARWARNGHEITYFLITCGDKGRNNDNKHIPANELCEIRHAEEYAAASIIGVKDVYFLDLDDGYLEPTLHLRKTIVGVIRKYKPEILVTCDPQNLFATYGLNHPDHRAAGQVVLDAVFPAAGNELFFPELMDEGYLPHTPKEVWTALTTNPNIVLDVTNTWEVKIEALKQHRSQIGDPAVLEERIRNRRTADSTAENPRYEEQFRVIDWR